MNIDSVMDCYNVILNGKLKCIIGNDSKIDNKQN